MNKKFLVFVAILILLTSFVAVYAVKESPFGEDDDEPFDEDEKELPAEMEISPSFVPVPLTGGICGGAVPCVCGDTLNESRTFTAADNVANCGGHGIIIGADDLILDCTNHAISGNGSNYGIYINETNNTLIKNCNINNWSVGIYAKGSNYTLDIQGNQINSNNDGGIGCFVDWNLNINITNNTINDNGCSGSSNGTGGGIRIHGTNNSTIVATVTDNLINQMDESGDCLRIGWSYDEFSANQTYLTLLRNQMESGTSGYHTLRLNALSYLQIEARNNAFSSSMRGDNPNQIGYYRDDAIANEVDAVFIDNIFQDTGHGALRIMANDTINATITDNVFEGTDGGGTLRIGWSCNSMSTITKNVTASVNRNNFTTIYGGAIVTRAEDNLNVNIYDNIIVNETSCGNRDVVEVISDNDIDAEIYRNTITNFDSNSGLYVEASTTNLVDIQDNRISNGVYGIYLDEIDNATVNNNIISVMGEQGIYLEDSNSNNLTNNNVTIAYEGVYFDSSSNNNDMTGNFICWNYLADVNDTDANDGGAWDDNNTCDVTDNWNDTTSGNPCTYSCPASTTYSGGCNNGTYNYTCGETVTTSCTLNNNLLSFDTCFTFGASDITIDGAGYSILGLTGSRNGDGIYANGVNNVTLMGLKISGFDYGIYLNNSNHSTFTSNTVNSNQDDGIYMEYSNHNTFTSNTVNSNQDDGIQLDYSNNNKFTGNTVNLNDGEGFELDDSDNNTFTGNTINLNDNEGFELDYSDNNTFSSNTLSGNTNDGMEFDYSYGNTISGNTLTLNTDEGLDLYKADNTNIVSNTITSNEEEGVYMRYSSGSTIRSNKINSNGQGGNYEGLDIQDSDNMFITSNTVNSNSDEGIRLYNSDHNNITNNDVLNNDVGIYLDNSINNKIENNVIRDNTDWNFWNDQADNVSAENNCWGLTTATAIDATINDSEESNGSNGEVDFEPFDTSCIESGATYDELPWSGGGGAVTTTPPAEEEPEEEEEAPEEPPAPPVEPEKVPEVPEIPEEEEEPAPEAPPTEGIGRESILLISVTIVFLGVVVFYLTKK